MILSKYGIELHRVKSEDLELIRMHRNSEFVQSKMFYQKEISSADQIKWFDKIDNDKNYYFVVKHQGKPVGLAHGIVHSFEKNTAEGGVFFWEKEVLQTPVPVIVSVCMADLTFLLMKIDKTIAEVRTDNTTAINYNKQLGYVIVKELVEEGKIIMELTKDSYFKNAGKYRELVKKISRDDTDISWKDIFIPKQTDSKLYENLPQELRTNFVNRMNDN